MKFDKTFAKKSSFFRRIAARIIAKMLLETPDATWQVFGEPWGDSTANNCVFERHTSFAQRILRSVGYSVSEYDLMTRDQKNRADLVAGQEDPKT